MYLHMFVCMCMRRSSYSPHVHVHVHVHAQELIFPASKPERARCRIRLRKLRKLFAPKVCKDVEGGFEMPPKEEQPKPGKLVPSLPKIDGFAFSSETEATEGSGKGQTERPLRGKTAPWRLSAQT